MGRYRGPVNKKSRRLGFSILETGKEFTKGKQRTTVPGQHGGARQKKKSDYGLHLAEKQKLRFLYGMNEKQFRTTFFKASKRSGITGTNFMQMLETRLDNLVYRAGLAKTRRQARQFVTHNHFMVNGKKANIPSMQITIGSTVVIRQKSKDMKELLEAEKGRTTSEWITLDKTKKSFTLNRLPERKELNKEVSEGLIVEYYNK